MAVNDEGIKPEEEKRSASTATASSSQPDREITNMDLLMDISLRVTVELGRTRMTLHQVLELQNGSVVELDRLAGDPVDIFINDRLIAHGEVVVVDDKFGVRITELVSHAVGNKG
ncbi:MAG: flagellar motor switch protein FliN [Anaerolineaceae bacterium]|jgi:flagellar motor switch protein FliN/FliY